MTMTDRRDFVIGMFAAGASGLLPAAEGLPPPVTQAENAVLDEWQGDTDLVAPEQYGEYFRDGDTRGLVSLEKLERAFEKVFREARETEVGDVPAVWNVYNMGFVVKSREALFSIDLVHRCAAKFAPLLDFALITHNHDDHWRRDFYRLMDGAHKTVVSNFLDNYGARLPCPAGYTRAVKEFRIKDVEVRTTLIDHNAYLVDFTTAFEVRIGDFVLYHTGDSGKGTEGKLCTKWGRPDLWLFFPGCGIDVAKAVRKVNARRIVFGHLWELGHKVGRLTAPLVRKALAAARPCCGDVSFALWGDKVL